MTSKVAISLVGASHIFERWTGFCGFVLYVLSTWTAILAKVRDTIVSSFETNLAYASALNTSNTIYLNLKADPFLGYPTGSLKRTPRLLPKTN